MLRKPARFASFRPSAGSDAARTVALAVSTSEMKTLRPRCLGNDSSAAPIRRLQSPILRCRLSTCCLPLVRSSLLTKQGGNGRADRPGICVYPRSGRWESALAFQNAARIWSNDACRRYTYVPSSSSQRPSLCFGRICVFRSGFFRCEPWQMVEDDALAAKWAASASG